MALRPLSFHIAASACLLGQTAPHFTVTEAIRAEWARQAPAFTEADKAKLSREDRARLDLTIRRIGQPGAPDLLPPELSSPTAELWLARAKAAKTPRDRFDALFFLNRVKRPEALTALAGLRPEDAATWPRHLHLEAGIATARLNGAEVSAELQAFLDALQKAGKVDPVRAQAARLRLVMGGKEKELLPTLPATAGRVLALMDAWNRGTPEQRSEAFPSLREGLSLGDHLLYHDGEGARRDALLGLSGTSKFHQMLLPRLMDGLPTQSDAARSFAARIARGSFEIMLGDSSKIRWAGLAAMGALGRCDAASPEVARVLEEDLPTPDPILLAGLLQALRKHDPARADATRQTLLAGSHPIARAAAIEDLPSAPSDLADLTKRVWNDAEFEPQQTLIQSYARWKMPPEDQKTQLLPWLQHPEWACRWEAYQALKKLDPATPWPAAPAPTKEQHAILRDAERLAQAGKPVRLRLTFEGRRRIVLRLDPTVAPINVANLVHLVRKGFFNGRRVPRVVPDFVVQMGSPYDTMDGGPGYTVRCEDSLEWYGPGSVGMALGGKDTGGSQFFITTNATPHLTGKYTRMGEVEDPDRGLPLLDELELGAKIEKIEVLKR